MYFIIAILLFYVTILFSFNDYTLFDYIIFSLFLKVKYIKKGDVFVYEKCRNFTPVLFLSFLVRDKPIQSIYNPF